MFVDAGYLFSILSRRNDKKAATAAAVDVSDDVWNSRMPVDDLLQAIAHQALDLASRCDGAEKTTPAPQLSVRWYGSAPPLELQAALDRAGWSVRTRHLAKACATGLQAQRGVDAALSIDLLECAILGAAAAAHASPGGAPQRTMVLLAGDGDFAPAVVAARATGASLAILTHPSSCSGALRAVATSVSYVNLGPSSRG
jgi:hypothetical protein